MGSMVQGQEPYRTSLQADAADDSSISWTIIAIMSVLAASAAVIAASAYCEARLADVRHGQCYTPLLPANAFRLCSNRHALNATALPAPR